MKLKLFALAGAAFGLAAQAAEVPAVLAKLAGCYQLKYHYVEAGRPEYHEEGVEYISAPKREGDAYVLQHYGVHGDSAMVHWGQRWTEAGPGNWTLAVTSPSGAERYRCDGPWAATETGVHYRRCEARMAPKPRRDRDRTDYDKLDRVHWWHLSQAGLLDEQHNLKRKSDGTLVAVESGQNDYRRLVGAAAKACDPARKLAGD